MLVMMMFFTPQSFTMSTVAFSVPAASDASGSECAASRPHPNMQPHVADIPVAIMGSRMMATSQLG